MKQLLTLVAMQLADKLDFSYLKNFRSAIIKIVLSIVKFIVVTAVFYLMFMVCSLLKIFGAGKQIPDTVLAVIFTIIQLMSLIGCTIALTNSLYKSADNKVLLTLPVKHNEVFFSKLILYFIYELLKNLNFTLPLFIAYGLNNGAVFYYYLWLILGFVLVSLLPVVMGAVLSIPWLFISSFINRFKILQGIIIVASSLIIAYIFFAIVNLIPENINIVAQWNNITQNIIPPFLRGFTDIFSPYYKLTLMIVGGTLTISTNLFLGRTFIYFALVIVFELVFVLIAYFLAKPLFFKMASKQFEFEKKVIPEKKNVVHNRYASPMFQEIKRNLRSSKYIAYVMLQLLLPAMLIFLLNKLYSAMQTSFNGQFMTKAFNMLVLYLSVLSFNNEFASIYSRDGNARYLEKTRPINPQVLTFSRLIPRIIISIASIVLASFFYVATSKASNFEFICVCITGSCISVAHLLLSAEMDIMNPQSEQYATIGMTFNNPNERNATLYSFILSVLFAFLVYFLAPTGLNSTFVKLAILSFAFLVGRVYLYFIRVKLYYKEK